jgi:phosphoenolpyruvate-protein kinase (PTS system EI component)
MAEKGQTLIIQGIQISPGVAKGNIHIHRNLPGPIDGPDNIPDHHIDEELSRLDVATVRISDELVVLATRVEKEMDSRLAEVFGAHQLILNDSLLREELRKEIIENLVSASSAVKMVFLRWEKRFLLMESQIARDKGDDIRDISNRLPAQCPCRDHGSPVGRDPSWLCTCDLAFTAFRHCLSL